MQDLTLINTEDDLALHTSDARMRREAMDDMSSGASTLPRAKSSAARQSEAAQHTHTHTSQHRFISSFTCRSTISRTSALMYKYVHTLHPVCWLESGVSHRGLALFNSSQAESCDLKHCRMGGKRWRWGRDANGVELEGVKKHVIQVGGEAWKEGGLCVCPHTAGWLDMWAWWAVNWIQRERPREWNNEVTQLKLILMSQDKNIRWIENYSQATEVDVPMCIYIT